MRRKQLFAIILAGALAAGSAPAAVFAAESDMAAMSEEGVGNAGSEEAGSEDGSSDAEAPVTDGADAADAATDTPVMPGIFSRLAAQNMPAAVLHPLI